MKMKEGTIFLVVLTFALFGVSSGERKLIRLDEEQRLADEGTQWEILISNFLKRNKSFCTLTSFYNTF